MRFVVDVILSAARTLDRRSVWIMEFAMEIPLLDKSSAMLYALVIDSVNVFVWVDKGAIFRPALDSWTAFSMQFSVPIPKCRSVSSFLGWTSISI
jgi:hypothetical protein